MIAAIYARKSNEQNGQADDQKSVSRQVEHARAFAEGKGWTVDDESIFIDDGISGAEFANRPGYLRLMNALKPRPRFQVLVMSELSRLGREQFETGFALKELSQAGVRTWSYMDQREIETDTPIAKLMLSLHAFSAEVERDKSRQRTHDALLRKARAGHVTGGRVFGFDNVDVMAGADSSGRPVRSHVVRQINESEAAVVRRIFELARKGYGLTMIAKMLNADATPAPRPQQGRPRAWAPSTVREILYRPLYRGEIVWNQSQKRGTWGKVQPHARPAGDWITVPAPQLRIVPEDLWTAVQAQLAESRGTYLRGTDGRLWGRPGRGVESKYLLSGLARCAQCNGSLYVKSRSHGKHRAYFYGCTSFHLRGSSVCSNGLEVSMERSNDAVLEEIEKRVLRQPAVLAETLRKAIERVQPHAEASRATRDLLERQLAATDGELQRLAAAVAAGGPMKTLVTAIATQEEARARVQEQLDMLGAMRPFVFDKAVVERELRAKMDEWRVMLRKQIPQARQVLKKLLEGPILFTPHREMRDGQQIREYEFRAPIAWKRLLAGTICANLVTSPTGFEPVFWP